MRSLIVRLSNLKRVERRSGIPGLDVYRVLVLSHFFSVKVVEWVKNRIFNAKILNSINEKTHRIRRSGLDNRELVQNT